jgi:hypothetical protein
MSRRHYLYLASLCFALLVAFLLPFPWRVMPWQQHATPWLLGNMFRAGEKALQFIPSSLYRSDSRQQLWLYALLGVLAFAVALFIKNTKSFKKEPQRVINLLQSLLALYLSAVLIRYGCEKIFKLQFYMPEPNTLYTPFGMLDKDILYWSTIGTSRSYNIFLGGTEVLAALLVFFRPTRRAGLLLAASVFIQVLAVDLCFGITVRLFSAFLLLCTIILLAPDAGRWIHFFRGDAVAAMPAARDSSRWFRVGKLVAGLLLLIEAFLPAWQSGTINDDARTRPPLHGAYVVTAQAPEYFGGLPPSRRVFVHRAGYLVLQDSADRLQSFPLRIDTIHKMLHVQTRAGKNRSFWYRYDAADSLLIIHTTDKIPAEILRARMLHWRNLPALR